MAPFHQPMPAVDELKWAKIFAFWRWVQSIYLSEIRFYKLFVKKQIFGSHFDQFTGKRVKWAKKFVFSLWVQSIHLSEIRIYRLFVEDKFLVAI